ncbi:hypothetical protein ACSSS7_007108 [Eimeria intestinalis]
MLMQRIDLWGLSRDRSAATIERVGAEVTAALCWEAKFLIPSSCDYTAAAAATATATAAAAAAAAATPTAAAAAQRMSEQKEKPKPQKAARRVSLNLTPEAVGPPSRPKNSEAAAKLLQQKRGQILKHSSSSSSSTIGKLRSIGGNTSGSRSSIGGKKSSSSNSSKDENSKGLSSNSSSSSSNGSEIRRGEGSKYDGICSSSSSSSNGSNVALGEPIGSSSRSSSRLVGRGLKKSSSSSSSSSSSGELSVSLPLRSKASAPGQLIRSVGFVDPSPRAATAGTTLRRLPAEASSLLKRRSSSSSSNSSSSSRAPSVGSGAVAQVLDEARLKESSRELRLRMRGASQETEAFKGEIEAKTEETAALSEAFNSDLASLGKGLFLQTNRILKDFVAPDWQIPDNDSLIELMRLRPPEMQKTASAAPNQTAKFPYLIPGSPVAPRRTSLSLPPHRALKREGYWEGPSAEEVFGDRILTPGSPYTLLGVIAVRAKEAVVSASLGGDTQGTAADCLLSAAAACLPRGPPPPRGLITRPVVPGLVDVCCSTSPPVVYRPPLYASKQPPAGYPLSPIETSNLRIVSELEDFLQETVRVVVRRPTWDSRASPVDLPNPQAYYHERRMQQVLSQQPEQQQQQQQQREGEWSCVSPLERIKCLLHEVSLQRALQHAARLTRKTLWRPAVSLLTSRERKTIKDFWRLRREGDTFLWDFEGLQIQDLDDFAAEVPLELPALTPEEVQQQEQQAARRQPDKRLLALLQQLNQLTGRSPSMF